MRKIIIVHGVSGLAKDDIIDFIVEDFSNVSITRLTHFDDRYFEDEIPWLNRTTQVYTWSTCPARQNIDFPRQSITDLENEGIFLICLVDMRTKEFFLSEYGERVISLVVKPKDYKTFDEWIDQKFEKGTMLSNCFPEYSEQYKLQKGEKTRIILERQHDQPLSDDEKKEIRTLLTPHLS